MDKVTVSLRGLRLYAHHGVLPQERVVGNEFVVDITLRTPVLPAAVDDDRLDGTVNYARVADIAAAQMATPSALLEHVAGRIVRALSAEFPQAEHITVAITKTAPPIPYQVDGATVTLEWNKSRL